jgi:hypothetical protein
VCTLDFTVLENITVLDEESKQHLCVCRVVVDDDVDDDDVDDDEA